MTTEIQRRDSFDTDTLRGVTSFADAMELFAGDVLTADSELGDGFAMIKNKDSLVGVPCLFMSWSFNTGEYADEFVAARIVTEDGRKVVIIDGGTGIRQQLREFTDSHGGRQGGLLSRRGLRKSEYTYTDENGKEKDAETFYIDTSA